MAEQLRDTEAWTKSHRKCLLLVNRVNGDSSINGKVSSIYAKVIFIKANKILSSLELILNSHIKQFYWCWVDKCHQIKLGMVNWEKNKEIKGQIILCTNVHTNTQFN